MKNSNNYFDVKIIDNDKYVGYGVSNNARIEINQAVLAKTEEDAIYLVNRNVNDYESLPLKFRDNPKVLKSALTEFIKNNEYSLNSNKNSINPISFARKNALTKDNIDLALQVPNARILERSYVLNIPYFVINAYKKGVDINYKDLSKDIRNNADVLYEAILAYDTNSKQNNPLTYALEDALTEENIRLALEKGNILFSGRHPLIESELFHRINIELGCIRKVEYRLLPDSIKKDDELIKKYVSNCPESFKDLEEERRDNPIFLEQALSKFESTFNDIRNPISYARKNALTNENIKNALSKGMIEIIPDSDLADNREFILMCLNEKVYTINYNDISKRLKNDPEIRNILLSANVIISDYINMTTAWSPEGKERKYKYFQAVIGITRDGTYNEEEVGKDKNKLARHHDGISKIITDCINKYPNDVNYKKIKDRFEELRKNPFIRAVICAEYGIVIVLIEGENAQIFFPKSISLEQFNILSNLITGDLKDLNFEFLYDKRTYFEYKELETNKSRRLDNNDVMRFINVMGLCIPNDINDSEDFGSSNRSLKK